MNYRVMIVEDSRVMYAQMAEFLTDTHYEVVSYCRSGEEALEAYGQVEPDLVTMDIILPGIDGVEAAEAIRLRWPRARIIMVSSMAHDETMESVTELGVQGFLYKPFDREALLESMGRALAD